MGIKGMVLGVLMYWNIVEVGEIEYFFMMRIAPAIVMLGIILSSLFN